MLQTNKDKLPADKKLSAARTQLIIRKAFVFYGSLVMRLPLKPDIMCDTAYTDGLVIGYNPEFIDTLTFDETLFLLAHEACHVAHLHQIRFKKGIHEHDLFNQAADYSINDILINAGFVMPGCGLHDAKYTGKTVEEIYKLLDQQSDDEKQARKQGGNFGEVRPLPKKNQQGQSIDRQQEIDKIKTIIIQSIQVAEKAGTLPGDVGRELKSIVTPPVNWRELLRRFMTVTNKSDYSMRRANRRYLPHGLYLPILYGEAMGEIVLAIDTSGSINTDLLAAFCNELNTIQDELKPEKITILYCDTKINGEPVVIWPGDLIEPEPRGGGGTRFTPVFEFIDKENIIPACLIYFTDMCCSDYPVNPPGYPVLWADYGGFEGMDVPFGEIIAIK